MGIGLTLLTVALWVGPIVAAFGSHGWNLKETLVPSQGQMRNVENHVEGLLGGGDTSENVFSVSDFKIDGSDLSMSINFSSPFAFDVTIEEFSGKITKEDDVLLKNFQLKNEVEARAGENSTLNLTGTLTSEGKKEFESVSDNNLPSGASFSSGIFRFETSGVTVEFALENMEEGSSLSREGKSPGGA